MTRLLKSGGGQGTQEIYWATNSCMDLKSKCNHYRWESLDVAKSSYLEPFKSCLADRCFKQRNKSIRDWRPDRESSVLLISFGSSFLFFYARLTLPLHGFNVRFFLSQLLTKKRPCM